MEKIIKIGCGDIIFSESDFRCTAKILFTQAYYSEDFILSIDTEQNCCEDFVIYDVLAEEDITDRFNRIVSIYHNEGELTIKQKDEETINVKFSCGEKCILNINITNIHNGYYPHFVKLEKLTREEVFEEWI